MTSLGRPTPRRVAVRLIVMLALAVSSSLTIAIPAHADPPAPAPVDQKKLSAAEKAKADAAAKAKVVTPGAGGTAPAVQKNVGNVNFNTQNISILSGWLAWLALLACVIGICISASLWALGSKGQNPGQELTGKKGLILCCTAAFFVGALPNMLTWLEDAAHKADTTGVTGSANP